MRSYVRSLANMRSLPSKRKQKGAVAIVFGLSLVTLFAMGGVVLDLGHMYIVTSELQNSADAAALAGAKRLNETAAGITNARNDAIALAAQNNFNFSTAVVISSTDVEYGSSPSGPFVNYDTAFASPAGKTFVRVDTGSRAINTYLMRVVSSNYNTVSTKGIAVAGRFVNNVTPIGVCAIKDPITGASRPKGEALPGTNELAQFGFRRGVSYNIFNLNPLGGPSNSYLINAVDAHPNPCGPNNTNPNITAPFVCNGSSAVITTTPGKVYGNVGVEAGKIQDALNSRFNLYPTGNPVCISAQAPPDINIKKYGCTDGSVPNTCATPAADWMVPSKQSLFESTGIPTTTQATPAGIASKDNYGVLWSYSRAVRAVGTTNATPGTAFATTDWTTLYPAPGGAPAADADFPATVSPYLDISNSSHFLAPTVNAGVANRRVLNLVIADCPEIEDSTTCTNAKDIPVLGIGRFFMQVPADFSGSPKKLEVEFAGLIEPVPVSEIKLYR